MKIKDILPHFDIDDDLNGVSAVMIYKAIVMAGKDDPQLSDYLACPKCGSDVLKLIEKQRIGSYLKGTYLQCDCCGWNVFSEQWNDLPSAEQSLLVAKYGVPKLIIV